MATKLNSQYRINKRPRDDSSDEEESISSESEEVSTESSTGDAYDLHESYKMSAKAATRAVCNAIAIGFPQYILTIPNAKLCQNMKLNQICEDLQQNSYQNSEIFNLITKKVNIIHNDDAQSLFDLIRNVYHYCYTHDDIPSFLTKLHINQNHDNYSIQNQHQLQLQTSFNSENENGNDNECILTPKIMDIVYDYLNPIHLFLIEPIVVELKFNNGNGAGWRITIAFNTTHDHDNYDPNKELNENQRYGVVSFKKTGHMIGYVDNKPFIFEFKKILYPEALIKFLNCDMNAITKQTVDDLGIDYLKYIECIEIEYKSGVIIGCKEEFRKKILVPVDGMMKLFTVDTDMIDHELERFKIDGFEFNGIKVMNSFEENEIGVHEFGELVVVRGCMWRV